MQLILILRFFLPKSDEVYKKIFEKIIKLRMTKVFEKYENRINNEDISKRNEFKVD